MKLHYCLISTQVFSLLAVACAGVTIAEILEMLDLSVAGIYREEAEAIITHNKVACAFLFIVAIATLITRILVIIITTLLYENFRNLVLITVSS